MSGPLAGLRVVDFTRFVAGSYATMLLGALGAEVIKVESEEGDPYRAQGAQRLGDESVLFLSLNSGKRSIVVDFRTDDGRAVLERLLDASDFFVENSRPGRLAGYGLDYESVRRRHPSIVYGSISGYGEVGPDAEKGGFDLVLQAETGIMSVTGVDPCGPVKVGAPVLDVGAALSCVIGLLAAHLRRRDTGEGGLVCSSLFEFALASLGTVAADFLAAGVVPGLLGTHSPLFAPYGSFRTADGWLVLAGTGTEKLWDLTRQVLGLEHLRGDRRFVDNAARVANREALTAEIESALAGDTTAEWRRRLTAAGVPVAQVNDLGQVMTGAQVAALGMVQELSHPAAGPYRVLGAPVRFDHRPTGARGAAPVLGQDTAEVLAAVGYSPPDIADLAARRAVTCR